MLLAMLLVYVFTEFYWSCQFNRLWRRILWLNVKHFYRASFFVVDSRLDARFSLQCMYYTQVGYCWPVSLRFCRHGHVPLGQVCWSVQRVWENPGRVYDRPGGQDAPHDQLTPHQRRKGVRGGFDCSFVHSAFAGLRTLIKWTHVVDIFFVFRVSISWHDIFCHPLIFVVIRDLSYVLGHPKYIPSTTVQIFYVIQSY